MFSGARLTTGVEVDKMRLSIVPTDGMLIGSRPALHAAVLGDLDGSRVTRHLIFMSTIGNTSIAPIIRFAGRTAQVKTDRIKIDMEVNSDTEGLNVPMPRNVYQPTCVHTLYDGGCALNRVSFAVTSEVTGSASTKSVVNCGLAQASGYFDLGWIEFTSGAMIGEKRNVKSYTTGQLVLIRPLPAVPATGDDFTAYPGCDKLEATCVSKFNNKANIRLYRYVPRPETLA